MVRACIGIAACMLCARAAFGLESASDYIFADGFEFPYLSPVWLPGACDVQAATGSFVSDSAVVFNTDVDGNCTGGVVAQTDGPDICVVRADTIAISASMTVTGLRALAFVADHSLQVDGTIAISGHGAQSGAGGGFRVSGVAPTFASGGGGAGFATDGGAGGTNGGTGNGSAGGTATDPLSLAVFEGGPRAAPNAGGAFDFVDPDGGGGGGALLLIACRGSVTTTGVINAGGGGGEAAHDTVAGGTIQQSRSAGGGGAGGYVVIEGLTLDIGGGLFANGGGGGGGNSLNDDSGGVGGDGTASTNPALGGLGSGAGGNGGAGGAKAISPTNGGSGMTSGTGAGGGGSVGALQLCTPTGVAPVLQPTIVISPDLAPVLEVQVKH